MTDEKLERVDKGFSLELKMKRGSGTRDQDEARGKIKTETMDELENHKSSMLEAMEDTLETAREVQPEVDE